MTQKYEYISDKYGDTPFETTLPEFESDLADLARQEGWGEIELHEGFDSDGIPIVSDDAGEILLRAKT